MRGDNGRSDGQAQSDAVPCLMSLVRAEAAERLEKGGDFRLLDDRSAVGDRELRHAVTAAGRHFDPAIGDVVPYRVVDEVRYQSFHQHGVAIGVGALAGVYPAAKAAHLAPAEALRTT